MEYATKEARLKSFEPPTKRSKAGWPHKTPSADAVATAGFYYAPHKTGDDNVACYLCDRRLDGWEEDDDPVQEHLRHSPECGYAIMISLARQTHFDTDQMEDPTNPIMEEARRATFTSGWPHECKRGWICKIEKMVEAGWHFTPTAVSEDYSSCAYCKLSLDGWEPKDNPFEEHYKRSPECPFFRFAGANAPSKRSKAKKGRASRTSKVSRISRASTRLSTQSDLTAQSDIPELDDSIDTSTTSIASNMSRASTTSATKRKATGTAKTTRAKKSKTEPEPECTPQRVLEVIDTADQIVPEFDETIDNSTTSVTSVTSTATAKGKKKTGTRSKATKSKKPKATRSQRSKRAEPEPEVEAEAEIAPEQVTKPIQVEEPDIIEQSAPQPATRPNQDSESRLQVVEAKELKVSSMVKDVSPAATQQQEIEYPDLERAAKGSPLQHKSSPYPVRSSPQPMVHAHTSPLAIPQSSPKSPSIASPAKSDIENAPPSSLPPSTRPPQPQLTPSRTRPASTWTPVDVELVFSKTPGVDSSNRFDLAQPDHLGDKERNMTVQEWIEYVAELAENDLRHEAERVVSVFEKEGARAMGVLESIECI